MAVMRMSLFYNHTVLRRATFGVQRSPLQAIICILDVVSIQGC
uniref:Uncharacterized protein n=1 Tax=Rhizophora mucronata TaxID=61149 RepID=A0A2P2NUJ2_RHIMU